VFTAADIQTRVKAQPLVPFRVTTSAGETFDVRHPEFIMVTRRFLEIGIPIPNEPEIPDKVERVFILHITSVKNVSVASQTSTEPNGAG